MADAKRDANYIATLIGVSNADSLTPVVIEADPTTKRLFVSASSLAATTDTVTAKLATDAIQNGTTALTPKFAFANVAASTTDSSIVAAVASKKIRVLSAIMQCGATATNITFNSKPAGAGTAISMLFANAANGGEVLSFTPIGWFETTSGQGLTVTTGAGSTTGVQVVYVEV